MLTDLALLLRAQAQVANRVEGTSLEQLPIRECPVIASLQSLSSGALRRRGRAAFRTHSEHAGVPRPGGNVALEEGCKLFSSRRWLSAAAADHVKVEAVAELIEKAANSLWLK